MSEFSHYSIESFEGNIIQGWAYCDSFPISHCALIVNESTLSLAKVNILRADVKQQHFTAPDNCGFTLEVPSFISHRGVDHRDDSSNISISFYCGDIILGSLQLSGHFKELVRKTLLSSYSQPRYHIDQFENGILSGWISLPNRHEDSCAYLILQDGSNIVAKTIANIYREDLIDVGLNPWSGFSLRVPLLSRDNTLKLLWAECLTNISHECLLTIPQNILMHIDQWRLSSPPNKSFVFNRVDLLPFPAKVKLYSTSILPYDGLEIFIGSTDSYDYLLVDTLELISAIPPAGLTIDLQCSSSTVLKLAFELHCWSDSEDSATKHRLVPLCTTNEDLNLPDKYSLVVPRKLFSTNHFHKITIHANISDTPIKRFDFVGVGFPKSATTSIFSLLSNNSEIVMANCKESHYFSPLSNTESIWTKQICHDDKGQKRDLTNKKR